MLLRVIEGHTLLQMCPSLDQVPQREVRDPQSEVSPEKLKRVVLPLGKSKAVFREVLCGLMVRADGIKSRQSSEDGEEMRTLSYLLAELVGAVVRLFGF